MPSYRIRYTQPVHVSYEANVQAENALDAIRKLLTLYGAHSTSAGRDAVLADIECNDAASEINWDAMEPVRFEYLNEITELSSDG